MCVCASVCVRKEVIEWVLDRVGVSVKPLWQTPGLQTFEKHQEPFLLPLLSSMFQPAETTSEVMVDSRLDVSKLSNFTCDFHGSTETWRRRPAPSACWVKIIKRRLLWVKGMKVWLTGEIIRSVSQSVRIRHKQPAACLTWTDNATTHQFTPPADRAAATVCQQRKSCWGAASSKAFV